VTTTAIQDRHAHNLLRLARVNAGLSAWDEYDANQLLPPDQRARCPGRSSRAAGSKNYS